MGGWGGRGEEQPKEGEAGRQHPGKSGPSGFAPIHTWRINKKKSGKPSRKNAQRHFGGICAFIEGGVESGENAHRARLATVGEVCAHTNIEENYKKEKNPGKIA